MNIEYSGREFQGLRMSHPKLHVRLAGSSSFKSLQ